MLTLTTPTSHADIVALIVVLITSCLYLTQGKIWDRSDPLHHLWFEIPQLKDGFKKRAATKETTNIAEKLKQLVRLFCYN
jgi:NADPH-ferrihemoprotein reductase